MPKELSQRALEESLNAAVDTLTKLNSEYAYAEQDRARKELRRECEVGKAVLTIRSRYVGWGERPPAADLLEKEALQDEEIYQIWLDAALAKVETERLKFESQNLRAQVSALQTLLRPYGGA